MEKIISFAELCKIKREQRGLNLEEAAKAVGYSGISKFEKGIYKPAGKTIKKLINYYRITDEEMNTVDMGSVKRIVNKVKEKNTIELIEQKLEELALKVEKLKLQGKLGKQLKDGAMENICIAQAAIGELDILDRII